MSRLVRIERHRLGPRVFLLGLRIHEYQLGVAAAAATPLSRWALVVGLFLIVKDWPDLFPATRNRASWRLGIHRLPRQDVTV